MDLVTRLLDCDRLRRLGTNVSAEIKAHPFFDEIDWAKLLRTEYVPCFRPPPLDPMPEINDTCRLGIEEPPYVPREGEEEALKQKQLRFVQWGESMSRDEGT